MPIRAGTDIAFLGGIINHILENEPRVPRVRRALHERARRSSTRTSSDTEDLDGLFSRLGPETGAYDTDTLAVRGHGGPAAGRRARDGAASASRRTARDGGASTTGEPPESDPTLQHPRCVFQLLKRHFRRYTPEMVERGLRRRRRTVPRRWPRRCARTPGASAPSAFVYSVGWTQHTVGVQYIRAAAIIQLLLGNIGRPGGGIMALRGHASIQGSTDIPTLYDILPGYIPMPHAHAHDALASYRRKTTRAEPGSGATCTTYIVSAC